MNGSSYFLPPERVLKDPTDVKTLATLLQEAAHGPRPGPLAWPTDAACGMNAYMDLVHELLDAPAPDSTP